jgi:three-Cys-motif partner protein
MQVRGTIILGRTESEYGEPVDVPDDGLPCPEVGSWAEEKHSVVSLYAKLFSTGMKDKWDERVYIELYAGSGFARLKNSTRVIAGSPIQALLLEDAFDKYIFCERDPQNLQALRARVLKLAPSSHVAYVEGDCNECVDRILAEIPQYSANHRVLTLCFVDPFDIGIKFKTLRKLADRFMDFLILLALYMDANRNIGNYVKEEAIKIDEFLGMSTWRARWTERERQGDAFPRFLAEEFSNSMQALNYVPQPFYKMKPIRMPERNVRLYNLALFSRHTRAYDFWDEVLKYSTDQTSFDWNKECL